MSTAKRVEETLARVEKGGHPKYHAKNAETGKLFCRERIARLVDAAEPPRPGRALRPGRRRSRGPARRP